MAEIGVMSQLLGLLVAIVVFLTLYRGWIRLQLDRRETVVLGLIWITFVTAPGWILGPFSYTDWVADLNYVIPIYQMLNAQPADTRFIHEYAGGQDFYGLGALGGQYISIDHLLFMLLPAWLANAVHKVIVILLWCFGTYLLARRAGRCDRITAVGLAGLASVFMYYASVGSLYLGYASIFPLAAYLLVYRIGRRLYWPGVIGFGLLFSTFGTQPLPSLGLFLMIPVVAMAASPRHLLKVIPPLLFILVLVLLNWHESFYGLVSTAPFTLRGSMRKPHLDEAGGFWYIADATYIYFKEWIAITIAATAIAALSSKKRLPQLKPIIATVLFIFLPWAISMIPFDKIGLSFINGLGFDYSLQAATPLFILAVACVSTAMPAPSKWKSAFTALVVALTCGGAAQAKILQLTGWLGEAGFSQMTVPELRNPAWLPPEPVRLAAVPYRLGENSIPAVGQDSLDARYSMVLSDVSKFWLQTTRENGVQGYSVTHRLGEGVSKCCAVYDLDQYQIRTDLMRIANIGFVVSRLPLSGKDVIKVAGPSDDTVTPRAGSPLATRLKSAIAWRFSPPEVFVYSLGDYLPRAYGVHAVRIVPDDIATTAYYDEIERYGLNRDIIVHQSNAAILSTPAETVTVTHIAKVLNGLDIELKPGNGGILAINIAYLPFWYAKTDDGRKLSLVKANGIQMAATVPAGTNRIELRYFRPLLRDRLMMLFGRPLPYASSLSSRESKI